MSLFDPENPKCLVEVDGKEANASFTLSEDGQIMSILVDGHKLEILQQDMSRAINNLVTVHNRKAREALEAAKNKAE